ncbi:bifunctional nuclease family protein [Seleniivibrio sp.]|uniref:bifunctional nuclease family protein n=1 Tax=Seleniivibrio sp. TaxID=2898801 RepID=UPI0025F5E629|nr:bifunctional nuclease family protein [Seleniivibrio sp.]MCD8553199.1 bifunctional nuclease family protein [Seleniivibrio sp.]
MIETTVKCVIREPLTSRYVLLLETLCGHYLIPVNVGDLEAESIYCVLNRINTPRPMTYEFIARIIDSIEDANIDRVVVDRYEQGNYKASIYVICSKSEKKIDCRPSDGIALAMRMGVPVYVEDDILCPTCCVDRTNINERDNKVLANLIDDQDGPLWHI